MILDNDDQIVDGNGNDSLREQVYEFLDEGTLPFTSPEKILKSVQEKFPNAGI